MSKRSSLSNTDGQKGLKILAIRFSAMGDIAMTVPVLSVLVKTYPNVQIEMLTRSFFKPLFAHIPNVHVYDADIKGVHSGVLGLGRLAKELRDEDIDMVADLHDSLRSNVLKSVFYLYGIDCEQIDKDRAAKKALTRAENKEFRQLKTSYQRYADVFEALGFPIDLGSYQHLGARKIPDSLEKITGEKLQKWIGIAPFAQHESKYYPEDLMRRVLQLLSEEYPDSMIFLFGGGEAEKAKLEVWEKDFSNCTSMVGKTSFDEELSLISNLDVMLSMDSGNGHLAAIFETPVVTLWGVTHPYAGFKPFGQPIENSLMANREEYPLIPTSVYGDKFPDGYENAMRSISPEKVVEKIKEFL